MNFERFKFINCIKSEIATSKVCNFGLSDLLFLLSKPFFMANDIVHTWFLIGLSQSINHVSSIAIVIEK